MEQLIKNVYTQAKLSGACALFTGKEKTLEDLIALFTSPKGMEFCLKNKFPNLNTFRQFKEYGLEKYGIYVDAGVIALNNPQRAILVGRTSATVLCNKLERYEIYVFQGASAAVNASGWAVVRIQGVQGCKVIKNVSGNAVVL